MLSYDERHSAEHSEAHPTAQRARLRAGTDTLLRRAQFLADAERLLMEHWLGIGVPIRDLAALHRMGPASMHRKLSGLRAKLTDPCFLLVAHFPDRVPAPFRAVAEDYFLRGRSQRECAQRFGVSLHAVRQAISMVRSALLLTSQAAPSAHYAALNESVHALPRFPLRRGTNSPGKMPRHADPQPAAGR